MTRIEPLPQGLRSNFEVVSYEGEPGNKTWVLRDTNSQVEYQLTPDTIKGWVIPETDSKGPSIIVSLHQRMVAMHLSTGEFFSTQSPPNQFRMKR